MTGDSIRHSAWAASVFGASHTPTTHTLPSASSLLLPCELTKRGGRGVKHHLFTGVKCRVTVYLRGLYYSDTPTLRNNRAGGAYRYEIMKGHVTASTNWTLALHGMHTPYLNRIGNRNTRCSSLFLAKSQHLQFLMHTEVNSSSTHHFCL